MAIHPFWAALWDAYCRTVGIGRDVHDEVLAAVERGTPLRRVLVEAMREDLGVPESAWQRIEERPRLIPARGLRRPGGMDQAASLPATPRRPRRRGRKSQTDTPYSQWKDAAGWSDARVGESVAASRKTIQAYHAGRRPAPLAFRQAVERLSEGAVRADDARSWPIQGA